MTMATEPDTVDLVIDGCTALVHDSDGVLEFVTDATIVVDHGEIVSVGAPEPGSRPPAANEHIDARGSLAMPGLINCHSHSPMVLFRGAAEDIPVADWFNEYIWPMEVNLSPETVELGARLAAAEMIRAGVTCFADHYFYMDAVASVVEETGLRANLGAAYFSTDGDAGFDRSLDFALRWRGRAGGRITTALAPHGTYTVTEPDLQRTAERAAEHDLLVHIHASENPEQTRNSRAALGVTPIEVLRRTGVLENRTLIAHGIGIVAEDLPILAPVADHVGVASAPKGYLKSIYSSTPVRLLRAANVPVGLATDGAASNNTLDLWESMLFTALVQKQQEQDPLWMTARDVLHHATIQSAQAIGLPGQIGRLAVGHRADIILVDLTAPHLQPIHNLAATLVYSGHGSDVTTTIVDGKVLMRDRELTGIDVSSLLTELRPHLASLADRSHGRKIQDYPT
jgi:5-methylthioadenosine/S-adenosylhomocysteine deaminase